MSTVSFNWQTASVEFVKGCLLQVYEKTNACDLKEALPKDVDLFVDNYPLTDLEMDAFG